MKFELPKSKPTKLGAPDNPKKRTMYIVIGAVVIFLVIYFLLKVWHSGSGDDGASSMSKTPKAIQSVQGGKISPEYMKALQKDNAFQVQQAKSTGGSSIGTIINTGAPKEPVGTCTQCCANCGDGVDLDQTLSDLVSSGKISPATQQLLSALAKQHVSPDEYAARLQELVREGKLTPEEARRLLAAYRKQYNDWLAAKGAKVLDALIKSGQLPLAVANQLLELQKKDVPVSVYAAALQKLVKEGKITSQVAAQLLAQYKKQHSEALAAQTQGQVNSMLASGEITHDVAKTLNALQGTGLSAGDYSSALKRLVQEGKLSPDQAQRLLNQYKKQLGMSSDDAGISKYNSQMQLSAEAARQLKQLQSQDVTVANFASTLQTMVKSNAVSAPNATKILNYYEKEFAEKKTAIDQLSSMVSAGTLSNTVGADLSAMVRTGVPLADYNAEVQTQVKLGAITLQAQSSLMNIYQGAALAAQQKDRFLQSLQSAKQLSDKAANTLQNLQDQNVSLSDYAGELKKLVQQGVISPQTANALLQGYSEKLGAQPPTSIETSVTAVPSSSAFSNNKNASLQDIQRRVASQQAANESRQATQTKMKATQDAMAQQQQAYNQQVQQRAQLMMQQAQQLMTTNWAVSTQAYVEGDATAQSGSSAGSGGAGAGAGGAGKADGKATGTTLIKAGTIMYAVLETAVNSDYSSSPVMATLVSGKFSGGKLLGTIETSKTGDRVVLQFSTLTMDSWPSGVAVSAYAIDPDTARTAIATSVNNHYMMKYGMQFAASFMQGLGEAIEDSGSSSSSDDGVTTSTIGDLDTTDKLLVALGTVGENLGSDFDDLSDVSPTVKVKAGVGLGILFMTDVVSSDESSWQASSSGSSSSGGGTTIGAGKSSAAGGGSVGGAVGAAG